MSKYKNPTCRGSYAFGSACGHCERCADELAKLGTPMTNDTGELKACPDSEFTERDLFLMKAGFDAGGFYSSFDIWLEETIDDAGHTVQQHLIYDANRLTRPDSVDDGLNWNASDTEYDMSIHSNPDHYAWADFFLKTFPNCGADRDTMAGWFANAMMAKHDSITALSSNEQGRQRGNKNSDECDKCGRLYSVVYRVPNDLWSRIAPKPETLGPHIEHQGGGMLCPECAVEAARNLDIRLVFVAHVWTEDEPAKPKAEYGSADIDDLKNEIAGWVSSLIGSERAPDIALLQTFERCRKALGGGNE